jgi:hypothetical protein
MRVCVCITLPFSAQFGRFSFHVECSYNIVFTVLLFIIISSLFHLNLIHVSNDKPSRLYSFRVGIIILKNQIVPAGLKAEQEAFWFPFGIPDGDGGSSCSKSVRQSTIKSGANTKDWLTPLKALTRKCKISWISSSLAGMGFFQLLVDLVGNKQNGITRTLARQSTPFQTIVLVLLLL